MIETELKCNAEAELCQVNETKIMRLLVRAEIINFRQLGCLLNLFIESDVVEINNKKGSTMNEIHEDMSS